MTSDYREALELCKEFRDPKLTKAQVRMIINSVPPDTKVSMQSIVDDMLPKEITRGQTLRVINNAVKEGEIIKSWNIMDGRRRWYKRKGAMD